MISSELYRPVNSLQIKGFTHSDIQGVPVPSKGIPFKKGHIPHFSVIGIENRENGHKQGNITLRKISDIHRRSYEFVTGKKNTIIFSDGLGNVYTQINTKGNNVTNPEVCKSSVTPSGFMFFGLQESDEMVRILRASELLRSHNVETEMIIKVLEPAELPYQEKSLSIPEFKKRLVQQVWENNAEDGELEGNLRLELPTRANVPQLSQALDKMIFFITVRATQVNERLDDLELPERPFKEFEPMFRNAFRYVNTVEKIKAAKDPAYTPEHFSIDEIDDKDSDDIIRYFNEYLPKRTAQNFAGMHRLGLIHKYPHTGNVSTVGSIYDLDSVRGEALGLGYERITIEDFIKDIEMFLDGNGTGFPGAEEIARRFVEPAEELKFKENFLKSYVKEVGWEGELIYFEYICQLFDDFEENENSELASYYLDQVVKKLNFSYQIDPNIVLDIIKREIGSFDDEEKGEVALAVLNLFVTTTQDLVNIQVRKKHHKIHPEDVMGPDSASLFSRLFAIREVEKVIDTIAEPLGEETAKDEKSTSGSPQQSYKFRINQRLIQRLGWEEDIVPHVADIDYLLDGFGSEETYEEFEQYLTKLLSQLPLNFVMPESLEELISRFHILDQEIAKEYIEEALTKALENEDKEKVIERALTSYADGNRMSPSARFDIFVCGHIDGKFEDLHEKEIKQLEEKYDSLTAIIISEWVKAKYQNEFVEGVPDEVLEEIDRTTKARIEEMKKEYPETKLALESSKEE